MTILHEKTKVKNLYSFDIFDTLITRKTATPKGIFFIMHELLKNNSDYSEFFRANFKDIRCETEEFVRAWLFKTKNYQDITFDEIYERIRINHSLTESQADFLKNLEIQCEIQNLIPIDENINKVKKLINQDEQVILISDMYHSEDTLKDILSHIDPVLKNIKIFVSSQYRKSKAKGDLYKIIRDELTPVYWEHTGDNRFADFASAKNQKIKANLYKYPEFKGYEKEALKENNLTTELIIGTAKNLRLKSKNIKYQFGASFAGPILYHYVSWIIESALKSGIKHLYFIARDGYIPKLIADTIIKEKNIPLKTHYLYGSRKAWRIPTEKTVDDFISYIFSEFYSELTGNKIAQRLGITQKELEQFTKEKCNNKILTKYKRELLLKKLLGNNSFKAFLASKNLNKKINLINYLKQEIDFSKTNFAFVDFNGSGRSQDILMSLISDFYPGKLNTFYFCCEMNLNEYKNSIKRVFISSAKYRHYWLELLCRNTEGQTIGYKEENGKILPILETINNKDIINWGFQEYIKGILDFSNFIIDVKRSTPINFNKINFYFNYFNYIITKIDKETADIIGSIPYSKIGKEKQIRECIPAYNLFSFITSMHKKQINNDLLYIAKGRASGLTRALIIIKIKYKTLRRFFIDIRIHKKKNEAFVCILGYKLDLHRLGF